jgi:hypothetical protein
MSNIRGATSTALTASAAGLLAFFVSVATALWTMWTMLGAAFDSGWFQVAFTLMLWMAAVGAAQICWRSATRFPSARCWRSTSRANEQRAAPIASTAVPATIMPTRPPRLAATVIMIFLLSSLVGSASAGGLIAEVRGGLLLHNATDLHERNPRGEDGIDGNLEVLFAGRPSSAA